MLHNEQLVDQLQVQINYMNVTNYWNAWI